MKENPEYSLFEKGDKIYCDSLRIAENLEKRHDHVLRDIKGLDCSERFRSSNFRKSSYRNQQNKRQPKYLMTKNGFMFLIMGYNGKKAAEIKERYISILS